MRFASNVSVLLIPAVLLAQAAARADDPGAAAQALFDEAKQLTGQGRYAEACPKFEESQKIDPGLGTQFQLANCWQHVGRTASAWGLFRSVESQARALGQPGRERVARDRAAALEPWLSRLSIVIHADDPGEPLEVHRDGAVVGREQWGVAVPVDPGEHLVTVLSPHRPPWQTTVEVPPDGKVMTVDVVPPARPAVAAAPPPLEVPPPLPAPPASASSAPPASPALHPPPPPSPGVASPMPPGPPEAPLTMEDRGGAQRAIGWFFVGAGVVGLGTGAYFAARWIEDSNSADQHCPGGICDSAGLAFRGNAATEGHITEAAVGAGGASVLIGAVLVVSAPGPRLVPRERATGRIELAPTWSPRGAGLDVRGSF